MRLAIFALFAVSCGPDLPSDVELAMDQIPAKLDFNIHVKPILSDRCFSCHGPDKAKQKAGLRLDLEDAAYAELPENPGKIAIVPGKLGGSELIQRILSDDPEIIMPPAESSLTLTALEKAILVQWIDDGAQYKPHWAFSKPERPALPKTNDTEWAKNEIDHFVQHKIEELGWSSSTQADPEMLLRRVTFDLTGLPPTVEEIESFKKDPSNQNYERIVDQLLASAHYGERMATDWMDVARFADTHGYTVDRFRDMSPWRDWVIGAFNQNMHYDEFIKWQLAGDLFPNPTREQIMATGFNRNHQQNMEGGVVAEEFRVEYVADRTNTIGTAVLGLTMECARCHDHKFDPITQKNYYEMFSFFNNVQESGQISWDDAMPVPTLLMSNAEVEKVSDYINKEIDQKEVALKSAAKSTDSDFTAWLNEDRFGVRINNASPKYPAAHFDLNSERIANKISSAQKGVMKQQFVNTKISPNIQKGKFGNGLLLDGDAWLDLGTVGRFDRASSFSIGIWANIPSELKDGVIFHKGIGAALYNLRGYHLAIKDGRLEVLMAHTAPYNAIIEYADQFPTDQWIHLMVTYDGTSQAEGLKLFIDGEEATTVVESDKLYKSILFNDGNIEEPGLQIGARWRGFGARGTTVDDIMVYDRCLTDIEILQSASPEKAAEIFSKKTESLTAPERNMLAQYHLAHHTKGRKSRLKKIESLRRQLNATIDTVQEIMVMQEMEKPRKAHILERGLYDSYGEEVFPNTPESLLPLPEDYPKNRLGLAQWLVHDDHPTTARVAVNRIWQQFFGRGLVRTANDFGNQGELPSHPELLDWLAVEFVESDWDVKKLVKLIVTSSTYRQSSKSTQQLMEADPQNIYLTRGPSIRLTAEMMRDNVLAASGLLVNKIGGKSVYPYQPAGLWRINGSTYTPDTGDKLYRRSMYTIWKRTVPNPTQATFDAPNRDNCTVTRQKTSTPLQALVLLNDPIFVEAAKVIGEQISKSNDIGEGINFSFKQLTGRSPSEDELRVLLRLQKSEWEKFIQNPEKISGWLGTGSYKVDSKVDPALLASNAVVASTIINADATMVKR